MATDRTERLLNLVICLLGAERAVSRSAIRVSVPGYGDAASDEAFERMFERDKDELRQMGIPIDTVMNAQGEVEGYRIDQDAYAMPPIDLDPAELAVLGVAARVWDEAALAAAAGAALRKIEATTGERWSAPGMLASRPGSGEDVLPSLWEAARERRAVTFTYLARGRDEPEARTVEPWTTVYREGAWYVVGLSRERGAGRAFRLSRIHGSVAVLRDTFIAPPREVVEVVVAGIREPTRRGQARISLPASGGARLRHRARDLGNGSWEVDYADGGVLVSEVFEAGGVILEPASLVEMQRQAAKACLERHGEPRG